MLLSVQFAGGASTPVYRDDAGRIWAYSDAYGTLPSVAITLHESSDCSGDAFTTQANISGLVVRHLQRLYTVASASLIISAQSYRDSSGTCIPQAFSTLATPLQPVTDPPAPPTLPFAVE